MESVKYAASEQISLYLNLRVENSLLTIYFVGTGPNKVCLTAIVAEVDELDVEETGQINTLERWFGNEQKAVAVPALVSIPFEEDLEDLPMKRRPQTIGAMVENEEMEESEGEIYLGKRGG